MQKYRILDHSHKWSKIRVYYLDESLKTLQTLKNDTHKSYIHLEERTFVKLSETCGIDPS